MVEKEIISKLDDKLIVEHNDLIRSTADMTVNSLKLFEVAVSAVDSLESGGNKVLINKKQLFDSLGVTGVNRNRNLTYALRRLVQDATFNMIFYENGEAIDVTVKPIYAFQNKHTASYIEMKFAPEILPFITELKNNFTRYKLEDILKMKSRYAVALYRWLMMNYRQWEYYKDRKDRTKQQLDNLLNPKLDLAEFRRLTGTQKKYKDFRNLRKRVLDTSVKEINKYSHYNVSWEGLYAGRKVIGIQFHISREVGKRTDFILEERIFDDYTSVVNNKYTTMLIGKGILEPMVIITNKNLITQLSEKVYPKYEEFEKQFGSDVLLGHISYISKRSKKIQNLSSYLIKSLNSYSAKLREEEQKKVVKPRIPMFDWT